MATIEIQRLPSAISMLSLSSSSSPHDVIEPDVARQTRAATSARYKREPFYRHEVLVRAATRVPFEEEEDDDDNNGKNSSEGSDFYDTDLETETKPAVKTVKTDELEANTSSSNKMHYRAACDHIGIAQQEAVALGLDEPEMNIRHKCLDDNDLNALCSALVKNTRVRRLQFSGNNIGRNGTCYLRDFLAKNTYITHLDLSDNDLGRHPECAIVLGDLLRNNSFLFALNLAGNNFKDRDITYLAYGIQINSRLQQLDLSRNVIGETGASQLGRAFSVNNGVDVLNLSWNRIRGKGAVGLCKGFQENGYVTKLDVSWNGFGYEGALAFGEVLKKNFVLNEVNLASNRIDWKAVQLIATGMRKNKSVETLILDSNPLTTTGCMDLLDAIYESNKTLVNLSLKGISVIGDFEFRSMMIRQSRPEFKCVHGGVISSHDFLGQRIEKRDTPLQKVLKGLREREMKIEQLYNDSATLSSEDHLAAKLKHFGVNLKLHEISELYDYLKAQMSNQPKQDGLSYKAVSSAIKRNTDRQRLEKIQEREQSEQTRDRHRKILSQPDDSVGAIDFAADGMSDISSILPPIGAALGSRSETGISFKTAGSNGGKDREVGAPGAGVRLGSNDKISPGISLLSMSTKLGSKAISFGEGTKTKKTKKTSGKSKKKKKKK